jgi:serine/threonine-protein kinase
MDVLQRAEEGGLTRTGSMLGSPHYMSPEQAQGLRSIDRRSDIWSLGVVLYKMLTGQTPHAHVQTLGQVILAICSTPARPVQELAPWVPPEIAQVVHRCLQPDPNHRYQTAYDLYSALQPLCTTARDVRRSHIAPLSDTQRMRIAQPLTVYRDGPTNGTQHGMVQPSLPVGEPKRSGGMIVAFAALGVLAAVGLAGIGAAVMARKPAHAAVDPTPLPTTPVAATAPPAPVEPPPPSAPAERVVTVAINPANAQVEVDGQKRDVVNGTIELRGPLGSVARVRVIANGADTTQPVAITESGPMPPKLTVAPAGSTSRNTPSRTPGTTAAGAKPPSPTGTGVNVQRTFE